MAVPTRIRYAIPTGGIRTTYPSDEMGPMYSPRALNVRFIFGVVRESPGRDILAGTSSGGEVRKIARFSKVDGTTWAMKICQTAVFRWGESVPASPRQWHQLFGPTLDTADFYDVTSGEDRFFFTGFDLSAGFYSWDGVSTSPFELVVATAGTAPPCKYLEYFNNRLLAAYTYEGQILSNRIRWSVNGDYRDWNGTGSGFLDVYAPEEEPLTALRALGNRCVVYRRHSIGELIPTGLTSPVHDFEVRSVGIGLVASGTLASNGLMHFFLATDNSVYTWDGINLKDVGTAIRDELDELVDLAHIDDLFGFVSLDRQEYWLVLTTGDAFVYHYVYQTWSRDSFGSFTAGFEVIDSIGASADLWSTVSGIWSEASYTWGSSASTFFPRLFAGRSDGKTFIIDDNIQYDYFSIGSIVDRYVETFDIYFPSGKYQGVEGDMWEEGTIQRTMLVYNPNETNSEPFLAGISFDRGSTWLEQEITPSSSGYNIIDWNVTGRHVRFRFRENNANGRFRWSSFGYEFIEAGPVNPA